MFPSRTSATVPPPVMEARRWLEGVTFPPERPLINVSQAAPATIPPQAMREAMAEALLTQPQAHLYGPVLGMPLLRAAVADKWSRHYGAAISAQNVAITSGCNEAYAAVMSTLTREGDEVILPVPYYFNHQMWHDMAGIRTVALPTGSGMIPDADHAAALITPRTRAIVLVSPNNPSGAEYPPETLRAFAELARTHKITLVVDETYRDFHSREGAPHDLVADPDWEGHVVQLYSFSKAYRLTGHRVGAIIASPARLAEVEKFLDTVTICPSQIGQIGALWGLQHLDDWLQGERREILARRDAVTNGFAPLEAQGWALLGCGAYFAYLRHPFALPAAELAQLMVREAGILALPGTMFMPPALHAGQSQLRVAFANVDAAGIAALIDRLDHLTRSGKLRGL